MDVVIQLLIYVFVLAYSCILHECAHVWVAWKLGDPTGRRLGRLTLHPVPHIDPFWTILLPLLMKLSGCFVIGGPKPAPVDSSYFRNRRFGMLLTAVAGPATNLLLAGFALALLYALFQGAPEILAERSERKEAFGTVSVTYEPTFNSYFLACVLFTNLSLAAFNMLPIPPLDGSRALAFVLGSDAERVMDNLSRFAAIPLLLLAYLAAPYAVAPALVALLFLLAPLFPPEYSSTLLYSYFKPLL